MKHLISLERLKQTERLVSGLTGFYRTSNELVLRGKRLDLAGDVLRGQVRMAPPGNEKRRDQAWKSITSQSRSTAGANSSRNMASSVLGVLTALGAEQAVEAIHHGQEASEARDALREELGWNLASLKRTMEQDQCMLARADEVEQWEKSWDSGHPIALSKGVSVPGYFVFRSSVWRITSGETVARMPLQERITYAALYDLLDTVGGQRDKLDDAWGDIAHYQRARRLSDEERLRVASDIAIIRGFSHVMTGANYQSALDLAGKCMSRPASFRSTISARPALPRYASR